MALSCIILFKLLQIASEVSDDLHKDGPFSPLLMYCESSSDHRGWKIEWKNMIYPVRIGLQCGLEEMWDKEKRTCVTMNAKVKSQLLKRKSQFL